MTHISLLSVSIYFFSGVSTKVESTGALNTSSSGVPPLFSYNKSRNKNPDILTYFIFSCSSLIPLISGCITTIFCKTSLHCISSNSTSIIAFNVFKDLSISDFKNILFDIKFLCNKSYNIIKASTSIRRILFIMLKDIEDSIAYAFSTFLKTCFPVTMSFSKIK